MVDVALTTPAPASPTAVHPKMAASVFEHLQLAKIQSLLKLEGIVGLLLAKTLYYLSSSIFAAVFMLAAVDRFGMQADSMGFLLAFIGITFGISQGVITGIVSAHFSDKTLNRVTNAVMAIGYAALAWTASTTNLYLVLTPVLITSAVYNTINMAQLTKCVPETEYGSILALEMVLAAATRLVSSALAGVLLNSPLGWGGVCAACSFFKVVCVFLFFTNRIYH